MFKENCKTKMLVVLGVLAVVITMFLVCVNVNYAYASNAKMNPYDAELKSEYSGHDWTDWEENCINDCLEHTQHHYPVALLWDDLGRDVWKVAAKDDGTKVFDTICVPEGSFDYDIKGYIGNCYDCDNCEPNVQFFYNTDSHQLLLLTFGYEKHDWDTINNKKECVLNHNIKFQDYSGEIKISQDCKEIFIGTGVTTIGAYTFYNFAKTELVDIWHKDYENSRLTNSECGYYIFGVNSFAYVGSCTDSGNNCKFEFLNAKNVPLDKVLDIDHISDLNPYWWADGSRFEYKGKTYKPINPFKQS